MSILVNNISKTYDTQIAVDAISFEIKKGEIVGFLGPNGAGKSTTMKMLTCYIPPTTGDALINGHSILNNTQAVRQTIGYLPEHNPLYIDMYVREYLAFCGQLNSINNIKTKVENIIETVGLTQERKKKISQLSKGYRQRVGLAQALLHDPKVLILDEPTSGLDPNQLAEIREVIKNIGKEKTVLLSTHIMQEVEAICDRVIIINQGKLVADSNVATLKQNNKKLNQRSFSITWAQPIAPEHLLQLSNVSTEKINDTSYTITSNNNTDLRPVLFEWSVKNNYTLINMTEQTTNLENVFKTLTQ
jgi:ABC-2 type transport system ATP-binding protein